MQYKFLTLHMNKDSTHKDKDVMDVKLPGDVSQIGNEAMHAIWQVAQKAFKDELTHEINLLRDQHEKVERKAEREHERIEQLEKEQANLQLQLEQFRRENRRLEIEQERKVGEASNQERHSQRLEEKILQRDQEVRQINENFIITRENGQRAQKLLDEKTRQCDLLQQEMRDQKEETVAIKNTHARLEKDNKQYNIENEQLREQNKKEYAKLMANEVLISEIRENNKKQERSIQEHRLELHETKDKLDNEHKSRISTEKKSLLQASQAESQSQKDKENITKLDHDVHQAQGDVQNLRNRMIRIEGAWEREKKAVERLEARLGDNHQTSSSARF